MALLWIEGFELFGTTTGAGSQTAMQNGMEAKYDSVSSSSGFEVDTGRVQGYSLKGTVMDKLFDLTRVFSGQTTAVVGFAFKSTLSSSDTTLVQLGSVRIDISGHGGTQTVKNGGTTLGTLTGAGDAQLTGDGTWHYHELKVVAHTTTGSFEWRIDGTTVLSASNVNTGSTITMLRLGSAGTVDDYWFDDVYLLDNAGTVNNDFLGPVFVEGLLPTSDGATSQWTPSTGTDHYAMVDDNPSDLDGTDNLETTTDGNKETFGYGNLTGGQVVIYGVQVNTDARKLDATNKNLINVARSNGVEDDGAAEAITDATNFATVAIVFEVDPDTSALWTPGAVDAAEFGFKMS